MPESELDITPGLVAEEAAGEEILPVSLEAERVASLLEKPSHPKSPRYDNVSHPVVSDVVVRVVHGQSVSLPFDEFVQAVGAARVYDRATAAKTNAEEDRKSSGKVLTDTRKRHDGFGGVGFPDTNTSATVVEENPRSIPPENIGEVVAQAGVDFSSFATQQLLVAIDIPQGLTDRRGKSVTAENMQARLEGFLKRTLNDGDEGIARFKRAIAVHDWRRLANLIRRGKVSHTLVSVDPGLEVRSIPLRSTPRELGEEKAPEAVEAHVNGN